MNSVGFHSSFHKLCLLVYTNTAGMDCETDSLFRRLYSYF